MIKLSWAVTIIHITDIHTDIKLMSNWYWYQDNLTIQPIPIPWYRLYQLNPNLCMHACTAMVIEQLSHLELVELTCVCKLDHHVQVSPSWVLVSMQSFFYFGNGLNEFIGKCSHFDQHINTKLFTRESGAIQALSLSPSTSPWEHILCSVLSGNTWLLDRCSGMLPSFSLNIVMFPRKK
jgi:hypothetical protein